MKRILLAACLWGVAVIGMPMEARAWTEPVRISENLNMVDPRGAAIGETLHVVASGGSFDFYYLKSCDNGLTWSEPVPLADTFPGSQMGSESPEIIYANSLLHIAWVGYYPPEIFHFSSSDGGETWSLPHQVFNCAPEMLKFPRLAANGDTLFICCMVGSSFLCFRSFDNGVTWQDSTVAESGLLAIPWFETLIFCAGKLHLITGMGVADDSTGYEIYYRVSLDYGLRWSPRIPLSTVERPPERVFHSQGPSAYADSSGHLVATWKDYKYGSMCGFSGDILARISTDNGDSWLPESRLTYTQSGEQSHGLIANGAIHTILTDDYPFGCPYPKITYVRSTDWGANWTSPELISGDVQVMELMPFLFRSIAPDDTVFHCLIVRVPLHGGDLYYFRSSNFVRIAEHDNDIGPGEYDLWTYPNPFNSSTTIRFRNQEGGELRAEIFNLSGQRLRSFDFAGAKEGRIIWDATDSTGRRLASGIYFFRLTNKTHVSTLRLLLLK